MLMFICLGIFFLMSSQPIFMICLLVMVSLVFSVYMYMFMGSYWFSYALIMVLLSGVLVIFTYMVSLYPNEGFDIFSFFMVFFFVFFFVGKDFLIFGDDYSLIGLNLWISYISLFNLFLVGFLFSIMLMVVWVSCMEEGAVKVLYLYAWLKG